LLSLLLFHTSSFGSRRLEALQEEEEEVHIHPTMTSITSDSTTSSCARNGKNNMDRRSFGLFPYLNDDLKRVILSYVADAPMEITATATLGYVKSSLTHQLPHVSRKFRDISQTDAYWKDAVLRQTKKEPVLWETALREIIAEQQQQHTTAGATNSSDNRAIIISNNDEEVVISDSNAHDALVQLALEAHHQQQQQAHASTCFFNRGNSDEHHRDSSSSPTTRKTYKSLYRHVVSNHLRFKGPVFFMPGQVQLGEPYALHFSEPCHRVLIAEVMRDFPDDARQGGHIGTTDSRSNKVPLFLHANRDPLAPATPAVVVQVLRCQIQDADHQNGGAGAHVVLLPLHHVWLEKLWVGSLSQRPGNVLYYAQALRMPQQVTHSMNHLARQEVLAAVMDQIATTLSVASSSSLDSDDDDDTMDSDDSGSNSDDDDSSQSDFSDSEVDDDSSVDFEDDDNSDFENALGGDDDENHNDRQGP
jgi:hypothetical protein